MLRTDTRMCSWIIRSLWGEEGRNLELTISFYNSHYTSFEKKQEKKGHFYLKKMETNIQWLEEGNSVKKK